MNWSGFPSKGRDLTFINKGFRVVFGHGGMYGFQPLHRGHINKYLLVTFLFVPGWYRIFSEYVGRKVYRCLMNSSPVHHRCRSL